MINRFNKFIIFCTTDTFAFILALLSILTMMPNSYFVFYEASKLPIEIFKSFQALCFSGIVGGAILYYALRGKKDISLFFCYVEIIISFLYYWPKEVKEQEAFWSQFLEFIQHKDFLIHCLLSLILPISVYNYVHNFNIKKLKEDQYLDADISKSTLNDLDSFKQKIEDDVESHVMKLTYLLQNQYKDSLEKIALESKDEVIKVVEEILSNDVKNEG
jgi:hypothetical protein